MARVREKARDTFLFTVRDAARVSVRLFIRMAPRISGIRAVWFLLGCPKRTHATFMIGFMRFSKTCNLLNLIDETTTIRDSADGPPFYGL